MRSSIASVVMFSDGPTFTTTEGLDSGFPSSRLMICSSSSCAIGFPLAVYFVDMARMCFRAACRWFPGFSGSLATASHSASVHGAISASHAAYVLCAFAEDTMRHRAVIRRACITVADNGTASMRLHTPCRIRLPGKVPGFGNPLITRSTGSTIHERRFIPRMGQ